MLKNKIQDLRNMLFETMERLLDDDDKAMNLERAETISSVAQTLINSAKVEVDFIKQTGFGGSEFLQAQGGMAPIELVAGTPKPVFKFGPDTRQEDLCLNCKLPECNETSVNCLVQIQRRAS